MSFSKSILLFLLVLVCVFVCPVSHGRSQDREGVPEEDPGVTQLTEEDKEIIRNLEVLENLDWLVDTDLDFLKNLEIFLTNS